MNLHHLIRRSTFAAAMGAAILCAGAYTVGAANAPLLATADSFAVIAGTTVTNTGTTTVVGNLGTSPGSAIVDSGSITLTGSEHTADAVALQAQSDVVTAYDALSSAPCTQSLTGTAVEIGGQTLIPGVYCYSSSAQITGTLTLDGDGVFIFKTVSTLTTAVGSSVVMIGGAQPCNVFWQVGSSADLFTNTRFVGNILALTSITLQSGTNVAGRAFARNGAVTMDTNNVSRASCAAAVAPTSTPAATASPVPATSTVTVVATPTAPSGTTPPVAGTTPGTPPFAPPQTPRLPNTGAGSERGHGATLLVALIVAGIGGLALGAGVRTYRRRAL